MIFNFTQLSAYHQALKYVGDDVGELSKLTHNLTDAQAINILSTKSLDEAKMADILVNKGMTKAEAEAAAAKIASSQANGVATFSLKAYTAALWANIKAMIVWMATNPVGWIIGFGAVIAGTNVILNSYTDTIEEQKEKLGEAQSEYEALTKEVKQLNDEIATNDARMQELTGKYEDGTITLIEEDELNKLRLANKLLKEQRALKQDEQTKKYNKLSKIAKSTFENEYGSAIDTNDMSKYQDYGLQIVAGEELSDRDLILSIKALYDGIDEAVAAGDMETAETLTEGQEELIRILQGRSNGILGELLDYQSVLELFMNDDGTFSDSSHQQLWDMIELWKKEIYRQTSRSGEWNTLQIETALDDASLDNSIKEIEKKFQDKTLTEDDIEQFDDLNTALESANLILEDGQTPASVYLMYLRQIAETQNAVNASKPDFQFNEANNTLVDQYQSDLNALSEALSKLRDGNLSSVDLVDLLQDFPTLINETDNLSEAIQTLIDDKLKVLKDELKDDGASDEILTLFDDITNRGKNVQLDEVLSDLDASHSKIKDLKTEIAETGKISASTLQGIINQYPKLEQAVNDYLTGKITEQDVVKALQEEYNTDLSNYYLYIASKKGADVDFYNAIKEALSDDLIDKAKQYGIDLANYKTYNEAKLAMDKQYAAKKATLMLKTDIYESAEKDVNKHPLNPYLQQQSDEAYNNMVGVSQKLAEVQKVIDEFDATVDIVVPQFNTNLNYTPDKDTGDDKDSKEEIDWAEQSLSVLQSKVDKFQAVLDNTYGIENQIDAIDDLNDALEGLKSGYEQAQENYEDRYTEALGKLTKNPEIKSKIESGEEFDLSEYDSETAKIIQEAIAAYNQVVQAKLKIKEITEQINKNENEEKVQIRLDGYEAQADLISSMLQDESLTAKEKIKLLEREKEIKDNILQQNFLLAKTEEEMIKYQQEHDYYLKQNEKSIYEAGRDERSNKISDYDSQIQDIQNAIDLEEAAGGQGTKEQYEQINSLLDDTIAEETKQRDAALAKRDAPGVQYGSDEWKEYNDQVQEAEDNINAARIAQIENNKAILELPIKPLEDQNKELKNSLEILEKRKEKIDGAFAHANNLVKDEVDLLKKEKETITDSYDDQIEAIEDKKEALEKENDAQERKIELEKAAYELEKAKRNRTVRVYRKGEGFVYESDQEDVRKAQDELDKLTYKNAIAELDDQIKVLKDEKEDKIEVLDDEIKLWEDYADELQKVSELYDRLVAQRNFLEVYNPSDQQKILSRDTGILTTMGNDLVDTSADIEVLEKKIAANESTIAKIKQEAEGYLATTTKIQEAQANINKLITDNAAEIAAIEARRAKTESLKQEWEKADGKIGESLDAIELSNTEAKTDEEQILSDRTKKLGEYKDKIVGIYGEIKKAVDDSNTAYKTVQDNLAKAKGVVAELNSLIGGNTSELDPAILEIIKELGSEFTQYHTGGIVGKTMHNELPEHLIALTDANLKPNETFAKLLNGEVVLNTNQMGNLFTNLNRAYTALTPLNKRENSPLTISIGDVNVYNPSDSDMIVNEIVKELPLKVIQRLHSK